VTGFSNGASMTYRLACERPDRIAAIAPVSGGLAEALMPACAERSGRPIPLALFHGTADPEVRFDSGELEGNLAYWIRRNGCAPNGTSTYLPDADPGDGTRTRVERHGGCRAGADVILYAIEGFSVEEIVAITAQPAERVLAFVSAARDHLRKAPGLARQFQGRFAPTGAA
jgi:polyhydroxybutyrate depolymerase